MHTACPPAPQSQARKCASKQHASDNMPFSPYVILRLKTTRYMCLLPTSGLGN